ncbi:receptor-like protein 12 [Vigna radiata var. radiata]|uniref:Receptor-like protein 12 n=1 Tax=Vigna radiata var. radiata TaxID=3916 RepID=A0A1S3UA94_VIGRR|nr:receptor-like protein 12 [Vigna radiata var. radiata]
MGWILVLYFIIFQSLLLHFSSYNCLSCNPDDKSVLLQFKNSVAVVELSTSFDTCGSNSQKTASWNNETDCCGWDGVICDSELGHVIGLDLSCSPLKGELLGLNSSIFKLSYLQMLNLLSGDLYPSPIHTAIGDLLSLTDLTLYYLRISGDVPSTISHLSKLEHLDLTVESLDSTPRLDSYTWNKLIHNATNLKKISLRGMDMSSVGENSLSLLTNLSSSLLSLRFTDTKLQGKWPTDILRLPNLQDMSILTNENLTGELPNSNWTTPLRSLFIYQTNFSGNIPDSIAHLKSLVQLSLFESNFDGFIPPSMFDLTHLTLLHLSDNKLVGSIPEFSTNSLQYLRLSNNKLMGNFPNFSALFLKELDISHNIIHGRFPKRFQENLFFWNEISYIDLSFNKLQGDLSILPNGIGYFSVSNNELSGDISLALCNATMLYVIKLAHNNFTGLIPQCLGTFPSLRALDLQDNNLYGSIPDSFYEGNAFQTLKLNGNHLKGLLPRSLAHCKSLEVLDLGNNNIEDKFPSWLETLPTLQVLSLQSNKFYGVINSIGTKLSFPRLRIFDISNNHFTGPLPTSYIINFQEMMNVDQSRTGSKYLGNRRTYNDSIVLVTKGVHGEFTRIFTTLIVIDLSNNMFEGEFPKAIGELKSLNGLNISHNKITGTIPLSLGNLTKLEWLDLSWNQLKGEIPILPNGIQYFLVSNNELSGDISSALCNAKTLYVINLAHNNLTGLIPQCLGRFHFLWALDLQRNNLYGSLPLVFSKRNAFETIKLNGNHLKGPLPQTLNHCTKLDVLDLGNNDIEDSFPDWLETLPTLQVLSLKSNKFHDNITSLSTKLSFPRLRIFDISNNYFIGPLPTSYIVNFQEMMNVNHSQTGSTYLGNLRTYNDSIVLVMKGLQRELTRILNTWIVIDLSNNMFEGEVPKAIGELKSLNGLNLSHNNVTGTIPLSLGNLRNLEWLDLSWNQLKGEIPMTLTNLNFLSVLNLSKNQLEGVIPTGGQFNTFDNISYVGNPMLCGFPLSRSCKGNKERSEGSTFDEEESGFGWKAVVVGYACGIIFGIILGYNVFFAGKPQWLARLVEVMFYVRLPRTNNRKRVIRLGRN